MYYVYIIQSIRDRKCYTGITTDIKNRMKQHNNGESLYTKRGIPWKLAWVCIFPNKRKAAELERYLKSASGIAFRDKHLV